MVKRQQIWPIIMSANLAPSECSSYVDDVEYRTNAGFPMRHLQFSKVNAIEIVKQVTISLLARIDEPLIKRLNIETSDGGIMKRYTANGIIK